MHLSSSPFYTSEVLCKAMQRLMKIINFATQKSREGFLYSGTELCKKTDLKQRTSLEIKTKSEYLSSNRF